MTQLRKAVLTGRLLNSYAQGEGVTLRGDIENTRKAARNMDSSDSFVLTEVAK